MVKSGKDANATAIRMDNDGNTRRLVRRALRLFRRSSSSIIAFVLFVDAEGMILVSETTDGLPFLAGFCLCFD
jgi:hypothetical protein